MKNLWHLCIASWLMCCSMGVAQYDKLAVSLKHDGPERKWPVGVAVFF